MDHQGSEAVTRENHPSETPAATLVGQEVPVVLNGGQVTETAKLLWFVAGVHKGITGHLSVRSL